MRIVGKTVVNKAVLARHVRRMDTVVVLEKLPKMETVQMKLWFRLRHILMNLALTTICASFQVDNH